MTLILDLTEEQEARIRAEAGAAGIEPAEYIARLLDHAPRPNLGLHPKESLLSGLKRIGVIGAFESAPRDDGRPWSEVEGLE